MDPLIKSQLLYQLSYTPAAAVYRNRPLAPQVAVVFAEANQSRENPSPPFAARSAQEHPFGRNARR